MTLLLALELGDADEETARAAEAAGFALVTLGDSPGGPGIEAGVRAAHLARRTSRIGLAPTLHVTTTEPFHLATQLASLDHASLGRAAWVVGADNTPAALATVGGVPLSDDELRREIADVITVARQLWDSWEDDAVIREVATGRFLDADRVHHVNFTGARFTVTGPLITPRPPQGHPVVLGADTLGVTELLDIALIAATDLDELVERTARARAHGVPLVFADLDFAVFESWRDRLDGVVDGVRLNAAGPTTQPPPGGSTLREALGLPRPANQFAGAR